MIEIMMVTDGIYRKNDEDNDEVVNDDDDEPAHSCNLVARRNFTSLVSLRAPSEDSNQTAQMCRLIRFLCPGSISQLAQIS